MSTSATPIPEVLHAEQNGYLETIGRRSGRARETEIWFAVEGDRIYLLSGYHNRKDWVRNLTKTPRVRFRIADRWFTGHAHQLTGDSAAIQHARQVMADKYHNGDLHAGEGWAMTGTPFVIEIDHDPSGAQLDNTPRTGVIETIGRRSGQPRTTQIGFAVDGSRVVMVSSAGASNDWVRNLSREPAVRFRIADTWHSGSARIATAAADVEAVQRAMLEKYAGSKIGTEWIGKGLPIIMTIMPS